MQTAETIITIGSLVLLMLFTLTTNSHVAQDQMVMYQGGQVLEAVGLAQKFIEEAELLSFDENKTGTEPGDFTYAGSLGPGWQETYETFDDIDDFNGFRATLSTTSIPYTIDIKVYYVQPYSPYERANVRTYMKKMVVSISSRAFSGQAEGAIRLEKIFAFHPFFEEEGA